MNNEIIENSSIFKRFKIIDLIGTGNYARVYKAISLSGKELAIKQITLDKTSDNYKQKFLPRELTILRIVSHKNICKIHEILQIANSIFIIMKFCSNGTIADLLQKRGPLSEPIVRYLFIQIVDAVDYMHGIDIAHRDIKVENILLDKDYNPKLTDFSYSNFVNYEIKQETTQQEKQAQTQAIATQQGKANTQTSPLPLMTSSICSGTSTYGQAKVLNLPQLVKTQHQHHRQHNHHHQHHNQHHNQHHQQHHNHHQHQQHHKSSSYNFNQQIITAQTLSSPTSTTTNIITQQQPHHQQQQSNSPTNCSASNTGSCDRMVAKLTDTFCGTLPYLSPEMIKQIPYDPRKTDIWSLGVCLYVMLNDKLPFAFDDIKTMLKKQLIKDFKFKTNMEFSDLVKDLANIMLEPDFLKRPNSADVLRHKWFLGPKEKPPQSR